MHWAPSSVQDAPRHTPYTPRCYLWRSSGTLVHSTLRRCGLRTVASRSYSAWATRKFRFHPSISFYSALEFTRSDQPYDCLRTGFGQHADYVFGWEGDSLQRAVDVCTGGDGIPTNCPELTVQDTDSMNACKQPAYVPEIVEGQCNISCPTSLPSDLTMNSAPDIERLPGCNPEQTGPDPATAIPIAECTEAPWSTAAPLPTVAPAIVTPPWTVCHSGPGSEPLVPNCDSIPPKTTSVGQVVPTPMVTGVAKG